MTRLRLIALNLFTGTGLLLAQDPQTGGGRRWNDPPPAPAPQAQPAAPDVQDQDPTQPVARVDAYGQPQQPQQQQQRNDRPPAAVPHYGLPAEVTIKPGTFVTVRVEQELSSDRNQQGDIFNASLAQPIVVDGVVVAQRGQTVMGRVAEAMKAGRAQGTSRLALQLTGFTLADGTQANVQSQLVNRNGQTSVGRDVATVATTTALGAAIGAAADWGRGADGGAASPIGGGPDGGAQGGGGGHCGDVPAHAGLAVTVDQLRLHVGLRAVGQSKSGQLQGEAAGTLRASGFHGFGHAAHYRLAALRDYHAIDHDGLRQAGVEYVALLVAVAGKLLFHANGHKGAGLDGECGGQPVVRDLSL